MLARVTMVALFSMALLAERAVEADPITYDFTGTFYPVGNANVNGSNQISGSFTINSDATVNPGATSTTESGSDVSITVNAGGHVYNFVNTAQDPTAATFTAINWLPGTSSNPTGNQSLVEYMWTGSMPNVNPTLGFGMSFYDQGGPSSLLTNTSNFNYVLDTSTFNFGGSLLGANQGGSGTITSIELVSAPEPTSMIVFAGLAIAAIVHRRWVSQSKTDRRATP